MLSSFYSPCVSLSFSPQRASLSLTLPFSFSLSSLYLSFHSLSFSLFFTEEHEFLSLFPFHSISFSFSLLSLFLQYVFFGLFAWYHFKFLSCVKVSAY